MSFEKLLQNIEVKVRGRTAVVLCGIVVLGFTFWVVLKDFATHPRFSTLCSVGILIAIVLLTTLVLFGKERPEERTPKSLLSVGRMDAKIVLAQGINSQADLMQLLRETSGFERLPTPIAKVQGSAANEKDYIQLTPSQAAAAEAEIEKGIESCSAPR